MERKERGGVKMGGDEDRKGGRRGEGKLGEAAERRKDKEGSSGTGERTNCERKER